MQTCYTTLPNTRIVIQELVECPKRLPQYEHLKFVRVVTKDVTINWNDETVYAYYADGTQRMWHVRASKGKLISEVLREKGSFLQFLPNGGIYKRTPDWDYYWGPVVDQTPVEGDYELFNIDAVYCNDCCSIIGVDCNCKPWYML
jgi:hypothetical protein